MVLILSMNAKIIFYNQKRLNQNTKFKLRRDLLGLEQKSNFSRYKYSIKGVLNQIPHYRPVDSTIIIKSKDLQNITEILDKYKARYETFDIVIASNLLKLK